MSKVSLRRAMCAALFAALVASPAAALAEDYVALGDSYSSGTGTASYTLNSACQRSVYAYPYLIRTSLGASFDFVACSGAKTGDVLGNQVQALDSATKYATISVGGNDAGFSSVITECAKPAPWPFPNPCDSAVSTAQSYIKSSLPARLDLVYNQMEQRSPNAVHVVVGYPRVFTGDEDCNIGTFFSNAEEGDLNATADLLADTT